MIFSSDRSSRSVSCFKSAYSPVAWDCAPESAPVFPQLAQCQRCTNISPGPPGCPSSIIHHYSKLLKSHKQQPEKRETGKINILDLEAENRCEGGAFQISNDCACIIELFCPLTNVCSIIWKHCFVINLSHASRRASNTTFIKSKYPGSLS